MWPFGKKVARKFVALVEGDTEGVDEDGDEVCNYGYWVLSEGSDETRQAMLIGHPGNSAYALYKRALVEAWLIGGSVPPFGSALGHHTPPDDPDKEPVTPSDEPTQLTIIHGGRAA